MFMSLFLPFNLLGKVFTPWNGCIALWLFLIQCFLSTSVSPRVSMFIQLFANLGKQPPQAMANSSLSEGGHGRMQLKDLIPHPSSGDDEIATEITKKGAEAVDLRHMTCQKVCLSSNHLPLLVSLALAPVLSLNT